MIIDDKREILKKTEGFTKLKRWENCPPPPKIGVKNGENVMLGSIFLDEKIKGRVKIFLSYFLSSRN